MYFGTDHEHIRREREKARQARKARWWLQKRDRGICHYCEAKIPPARLTMDHVVPLSRGGRTTPGNVVASCLDCNRSKSMSTPVDLILGSSGSETPEH